MVYSQSLVMWLNVVLIGTRIMLVTRCIVDWRSDLYFVFGGIVCIDVNVVFFIFNVLEESGVYFL